MLDNTMLYDVGRRVQSVGELNYVITRICLEYFDSSYQGINDIAGALMCAAQEFYRRVAVPYEHKKCEKNGDVYGTD